jgi:iron complex outermembrane receptor protein
MSERSPRDEIKGISALQYIVLSICLFVIGIPSAFAENARDTRDSLVKKDSCAALVKNLDKMVVFGTQFTHYTTSQTTLEARDFIGKYQDLQSVLETVSGVTVRDIGGFGHYAEAAIRGSSANQVQVYLDGVPLNGATGNAVDISKIPLSTLQKITVYKNDPPIEFSGDNAGGTINLSTTADHDPQAAWLELGSFGYVAGNAMITVETGPMKHYVTVNYAYADDNYPYTNDNGTTKGTANTSDDIIEKMDNNFFSTLSALYSNTWNINSRSTLTSQLSANATSEGIFYYPMADSNDGSIRDSSVSLTETYKMTSGDSATGLTVRASGKSDNEQYQRSRPFYLTTPVNELIKQPYAALQAILKQQIWSRFSFAAVADGSYDGFDINNLLVPAGRLQPGFLRLTGKAGIEAEISLPAAIIARIGGTSRYELDSTNGNFSYGEFVPGGQTSRQGFPGFYTDFRAEPTQCFGLYAGVHYSSRSPGFSEKYLGNANTEGNTELRPETRLEYETGFSLNKHRFAISGSLFASNTKDKIIFIMNSANMFVPKNMDDIMGWGAETDFTFSPFEWIALTNTATYMENTIHASADPNVVGNDEPFVPHFTDDLRFKVSYKKFYAGHSAHYGSPYYTGIDNVDKISHDAPELDVWIGIVPDNRRHFDFSYRLENYLNVRDYDFPGMPLPGIRNYLICKYTF